MLITQPSVSAFAFIAIFASHAIAVTNSTLQKAMWNSTVERLSNQSPNVTILAEPLPTDTPNFNTAFNLRFEDGSCSQYQQSVIQATINNIGGLAEVGRKWRNDVFHNWDPEVVYWFGPAATGNVGWITSRPTPNHISHCRPIH